VASFEGKYFLTELLKHFSVDLLVLDYEFLESGDV
jgi:hypothetical protein